MRNKILFSLLWVICLAVACSNVEKNLRQLAQSPSSAVAIKDAKDGYWGLQGSAIEQVSGNKITLKTGERIQYCSSGEGSAEILGRAILGDTPMTVEGSKATWNTESVYGRQPIEAGPDNSIRTGGRGVVAFSSKGENAFSLSGCVQGTITKNVDVEIKEILFSAVGDK